MEDLGQTGFEVAIQMNPNEKRVCRPASKGHHLIDCLLCVIRQVCVNFCADPPRDDVQQFQSHIDRKHVSNTRIGPAGASGILTAIYEITSLYGNVVGFQGIAPV